MRFLVKVFVNHPARVYESDVSRVLCYRYKQLKKRLKECRVEDEGTNNNTAAEDAFFSQLRSEMKATSMYFQKEAIKTIERYKAIRSPSCIAYIFVSRKRRNPHNYAAVANAAFWTRKFAKCNAVALRKILKKHDKVCQNTKGKDFLEDSWRLTGHGRTLGIFLHSPLLDELKAIQSDLQERLHEMDHEGHLDIHDTDTELDQKQFSTAVAAGQQQDPVKRDSTTSSSTNSLTVITLPNRSAIPEPIPEDEEATSVSIASSGRISPSWHAKERQAGLAAIIESPACMLDSSDFEWAGHSELTSPITLPFGGQGDDVLRRPSVDSSMTVRELGGIGTFKEQELTCPICLDIMYKPVGLACGHKFCKHCCLEACGFGKCHGTFANIITYIPSFTTCPQCRQPNAYQSALSLRELGVFIQKKYPELWAEKRKEDKERFAEPPQLPATSSSGGRSILRQLLSAENALGTFSGPILRF